MRPDYSVPVDPRFLPDHGHEPRNLEWTMNAPCSRWSAGSCGSAGHRRTRARCTSTRQPADGTSHLPRAFTSLRFAPRLGSSSPNWAAMRCSARRRPDGALRKEVSTMGKAQRRRRRQRAVAARTNRRSASVQSFAGGEPRHSEGGQLPAWRLAFRRPTDARVRYLANRKLSHRCDEVQAWLSGRRPAPDAVRPHMPRRPRGLRRSDACARR